MEKLDIHYRKNKLDSTVRRVKESTDLSKRNKTCLLRFNDRNFADG